MIWSVIFFLIAAAEFFFRRSFRKRCTEVVEGTVISVERRNGHRHPIPVYGYTYGGYDYSRASSFYTVFRNAHVGDRVTMLVDPNDPECSICADEDGYKTMFDLLIVGIGIFLFIIAI